MAKSIMIVGVGGQGTLLASKIIGAALISRGYDVKLSEVHGMSQRGGSVVTYVKYGEKVYSPIVDEGEADIILSFEALEAARYLRFLKDGGTIITNSAEIWPMPVINGAMAYPENIIGKLGEKANVIALDAMKIAREAGSSKAVNVVLLGVMSAKSEIPYETWIDALKSSVPAKFLDMNLKAFDLGRACAN